MESHVINILLVEDNPGDVRLTQEALKLCKHTIKLYVVEDGVKAMSFLNNKEAYTDAPVPDLILLDLNLPKKNGYEVLAEIKKDNKLRSIPVFILTTSGRDDDIIKTYKLRANNYLQKPDDINKFKEIAKTVDDFWVSLVKFKK